MEQTATNFLGDGTWLKIKNLFQQYRGSSSPTELLLIATQTMEQIASQIFFLNATNKTDIIVLQVIKFA